MSARPTRGSDPERARGRGGAGPRGLPIGVAPLLAIVGLLLVALISLRLLDLSSSVGGGTLAPGATAPSGSGTGPGPGRPTPNPSILITPPPEQRVDVRGTVLFVRTGNIWAASGDTVSEISDKGTDADPVWSPDGARIYFTERRTATVQAPYQGRDSKYTLYYPVIMSMAPDGSDRVQIQDSLYALGGGASRKWFTQLLQMDVSPDGTTFALISDAPDPFSRDATLSTLPTTGGTVRNLNQRDTRPLGHNDPDWDPRGTQIAYTYNGRNGSVGAPRIMVYDTVTKKSRNVGNRGYAKPDWSIDGRYILAERTDGTGRDIVVLDARTGALVDRLTADGKSFSPTFSADGKQIAYLRIDHQAVDLRIMTLSDDGAFDIVDDRAITQDGSIDAASAPSWYFPPDLRPVTPTPAASSTSSAASPSSIAPVSSP